VNTKFEKLLTVHLRELGCPKSFLERHFSGRFDFSAVRVQLVTSRPGAASGPLAESSGLLRLRRTVLEMDGIRSKILKHGLRLECCTGSVGWLNEQWLREFCDVASGKQGSRRSPGIVKCRMSGSSFLLMRMWTGVTSWRARWVFVRVIEFRVKRI
jgi:hypothetical protein